MPGVTNGDPAKALDSFGKQVHELQLLAGVLVEQQVQLVERGTCHDPVVFLVEGMQDRRVGQDAVEQLGTLGASFCGQSDRQQTDRAESLYLWTKFVHARLWRELRDGHLDVLIGDEGSALHSTVLAQRVVQPKSR